jgi:uncharacterized protein YjbJ (UPF0337 family)
MKMNEDIVKGKWREIRGDIQKSWGKLTNDELDKTKGDLKAISGLLQQRYGATEATYHKKISDIFERFEENKEATMDKVKNKLKK